MIFDGERVVFWDMSVNQHSNLVRHIERYTYAMSKCSNKRVIDASCGTMYGTQMLSWVARSIHAIDISSKAIEEGQKRLFIKNLTTSIVDLNNTKLPKADICVSFETIEHLKDPGYFLQHLDTKELVFSVPMDMPSKFHKTTFRTKEEFFKLAESCGWHVTGNFMQDTVYLVGYAVR